MSSDAYMASMLHGRVIQFDGSFNPKVITRGPHVEWTLGNLVQLRTGLEQSGLHVREPATVVRISERSPRDGQHVVVSVKLKREPSKEKLDGIFRQEDLTAVADAGLTGRECSG